MSDNKPIAKLTLRRDNTTFAILTVWTGKFPGTYTIGKDKGSEQFPAIGLFDALKSWGQGNGFLNLKIMSESKGGSSRSSNKPSDDYGGSDDGFDDDDVPF